MRLEDGTFIIDVTPDDRPVLLLKQTKNGGRKIYLDGKELKYVLPGAELKLTGRGALVTLTLDCRLELPPDDDT